MPFIGTQPEIGGYSVLDALTASATASYTLQKDSTNFTPSSANQLLVSLNGVIQKPGSSFTLSGSTLTFSSALSSSDSIDFIISMGEPLLIGTPSDGTITNAKLGLGQFLQLPSGTTANRPGSPVNGMVRYNTTTSKFEVYEGDGWSSYALLYNIDALVISGGGGGASGGGGAGGTTNFTQIAITKNTSYAITVGAGGNAGSGTTTGSNGGISLLSGISGSNVGGGGGGHFSNSSANNGAAGGSGGGAGGSDTGGSAGVGGAGTVGQGFAGGTASALNTVQGRGGGGGKGGVGANSNGQNGGAGGTGYTWVDGVTRASGGSGGGSSTVAATAGGGGAGAASNQTGSAATANTGGGGGGGGNTSVTNGGNGGSGVVIIRYIGTQKGSGGSVTSSGGYTYHTFNSSGTYTA